MIQGTIVYYNPLSREAGVNVRNYGNLTAFNILPPGVSPTTSIVNIFLEPHEVNTVLPSELFNGGDLVAVYEENGTWKILGLIIAEAANIVPAVGRPGPGLLEISNQVVTTNDFSKVTLVEFAERAYINQIKVVANAGGNFTVKIYNGENELQASWGNGSVTLTDQLNDQGGFPFSSKNRRAVIELIPGGNYTISFIGERFA